MTAATDDSPVTCDSLTIREDRLAEDAQRVLAFYDGRIIADAPPEIALNDPEVRRYVVGGALQRLGQGAGAEHA